MITVLLGLARLQHGDGPCLLSISTVFRPEMSNFSDEAMHTQSFGRHIALAIVLSLAAVWYFLRSNAQSYSLKDDVPVVSPVNCESLDLSTDASPSHSEPPSNSEPPSTPKSVSVKGLGKSSPPAPPRGKGKGPPPPPPKINAPRRASIASPISVEGQDQESPSKAATLGSPFAQRWRVRWRALQSVDGTVFESLPGGPLRAETEQVLREVFDTFNAQPKATSSSKVATFVPKSSGVTLLERNRAQQLAILFRRSPVKLERLCYALETLDFSLEVGEEDIDGWLQAWPSAAEQKLVSAYQGPMSGLRDVEQRIRRIAEVKRSESRLKLLRLDKGLGYLSSGFKSGLSLQREACRELLASTRLRTLLDEALRLGNYINHGLSEAGDSGFALDALLQLRVLKGSGGASALHCLCVSCAQEEPQFLAALCGELPSLHSVVQVSLAAMAEQVERLRSDVAFASNECLAHLDAYAKTPSKVFTMEETEEVLSGRSSLQVNFEVSDEESSTDSDDEDVCSSSGTGMPEVKAGCPNRHPSPGSCSTCSSSVGSGGPRRNSRPVLPTLQIPTMAPFSAPLCAPRGTPSEVSGITLAPKGTPRESTLGSEIQELLTPRIRGVSPSSPPLTARSERRKAEESVRSYLAGLPAPTPRNECHLDFIPSPGSARPAPVSPLNNVTPKAGQSRPGMHLCSDGNTADCNVLDVFPRNATLPLLELSSSPGNCTTRCRGSLSESNGTCGVPVVRSSSSMNATALVTMLRVIEAGQLCNPTRSVDENSTNGCTSPKCRLQALVARGKVLVQNAQEELAYVADAIDKCERYFGGVGSKQELSGNSRLFDTVVEVLAAFKISWLEVHRDDRWVPFLPAAKSLGTRSATARTEVPSTPQTSRFSSQTRWKIKPRRGRTPPRRLSWPATAR